MSSERESFDPRDTKGWYVDTRPSLPDRSLEHSGSSKRHIGRVDDTIPVVFTHKDFPEIISRRQRCVTLLIHRNSHSRVIGKIEHAIDNFPAVFKAYKDSGIIVLPRFRYGPIRKPIPLRPHLAKRT